MKSSFEYIENGDIVYYALAMSENIAPEESIYGFYTTQYMPIVGKFKVTNIRHTTIEKRDISDRWDPVEYKEFKVNKIHFDIVPIDEEANTIIQYVNTHDKLCKFINNKATIDLDFTWSKDAMTHTQGRGTSHNLFLSEADAIKDNLDYIKMVTISQNLFDVIQKVKVLNNNTIQELSANLGITNSNGISW